MTREAFLYRLRLMGAIMLAAFAASVLFGATLGAGFSWYNACASIGKCSRQSTVERANAVLAQQFPLTWPMDVHGGVEPLWPRVA